MYQQYLYNVVIFMISLVIPAAPLVIPAKAGIQVTGQTGWIPAFAGMTGESGDDRRERGDDKGMALFPRHSREGGNPGLFKLIAKKGHSIVSPFADILC